MSEEKVCSCCKKLLPVVRFSRDAQKADGLRPNCRDCRSTQRALAYRENPEPQKERSLAHYYHNRESILQRVLSYQASHPAIARATSRRMREKYPEKVTARSILNREILSGRIKKQPCSVCGADRVEAHHPDYAQPLRVQWLCPAHHKELHRRERVNRESSNRTTTLPRRLPKGV